MDSGGPNNEAPQKGGAEVYSELVRMLNGSSSNTFESSMLPMPPSLDASYRSAESKEFLKKHVILSSADPTMPASSLPFEDDESDEEEGEDDMEEIDIDGYTLKVRGEILDFFTHAAERINEIIDTKEALPPGNDAQVAKYDAQIEDNIVENKKSFEKQIRPKVAEYLTLIQESIRTLQAEEEELLKFCSTMYPSTCE